MISKCQAKTSLKQWLEQNCSSDTAIDDNTKLVEERVITSLKVMDLILFIEQLTDRRIEIEQVRPDSFASINSICARFFTEAAT